MSTAPDTHSPIPELIGLFIGLTSEEDNNPEKARETASGLLTGRFPSFTVTEGTGFFRGTREPVLVAWIATTAPQEVAEAAAAIRTALRQEGIGIAHRGLYLRATENHTPQLA